MKSACQWFGFLGLAGTLCAGEPTNNPARATAMTFTDLRQQGITTFVDRAFTLKARVTWEYLSVKIPEDQTPERELRQKAGPLKIRLEGAGFPDAPGRTDLSVSGPELAKKRGADGREGYVLHETALINQTVYVLQVQLTLRPGFDKKMLENAAFVQQCQDPRYWSQTFALEILALEP
jgi:hypothetical protein